MKKALLFFLILFSFSAKAIELSDSSRISLLTCSPGSDELYSIFGHTGIRVTDYRQGFDVVFNYGTFDFTKPGFYLNFCRGILIFMVSVDRFQDFRSQYIYEERNIYEQELLLANEDKQRMFAFLANNALPEHCEYRYDFLYDNCATRVRDVIEKYSGKGFQSHFDGFPVKSFRDLINDYSAHHLWDQFGMNLLIGLPVDVITTPRQECFLPDYLSQAVAQATINGAPLAAKKILILDAAKNPDGSGFEGTPNMVFGILLALAFLLTALEFQQGRYFVAFDTVLFGIAGLLGTLFFTLWFFTQHTTPAWNLNLLWAWPTHLPVAFMLPFWKKFPFLRHYLLAAGIAALGMTLFGRWMPQHFLWANLMISAVFAIRSLAFWKRTTS
ncbi:MAG: DUF4105 domain-containing protein [Chitinophagales bacterium]